MRQNAIVWLADARRVVLVEGASDRAAVLQAAHMASIDLEGTAVVAMGGATNVAAYVERYAAKPEVESVVGLCDHAERGLFEQHLGARDIFVCVSDLEDELLRAIGVDAMIDFIDRQGELRAFRTMQKQPAQRDRTVEQHLHRFCGSRATRKVRYARGVTAELAVGQLPPPLAALLDRI